VKSKYHLVGQCVRYPGHRGPYLCAWSSGEVGRPLQGWIGRNWECYNGRTNGGCCRGYRRLVHGVECFVESNEVHDPGPVSVVVRVNEPTLHKS
jgi:hypothetical protein